VIFDRQNLLSDHQNLAVAPGAVISTNTIDLRERGTNVVFRAGPAGDLGNGRPIELRTQVTEPFTSGGAATLQVQLVTGDNAALDETSNLAVRVATPPLDVTTLAAGHEIVLPLPTGINQRYLGVRYVVDGAAMTSGKVTAGVTL
jgi:hypothetical protein